MGGNIQFKMRDWDKPNDQTPKFTRWMKKSQRVKDFIASPDVQKQVAEKVHDVSK